MMPEIDCQWFVDLWAESFDGSSRFPAHSIYQPITSPIHQTGKTSFGMREWEQILETLKGWKADPQNIAFDIAEFMERRHSIHKYDIQMLDEPQAVASSRTWHDEAQNLMVNDLMKTNRYIKPALFPVPLNAMIDNRIFDIATSQVVVPTLAHAEVYYLDRPQLDRGDRRVRSPKLGSLTFSKPNASFWHAYCKRFDEYYEKRNKRDRERVRALQRESEKEVVLLTSEDLVPLIMEKPEDYIGKRGDISVTRVQTKFRVPYNRAHLAARLATEQLLAKATLEKAEKDG